MIKVQSVHLEKHYTKWTHMVSKSVYATPMFWLWCVCVGVCVLAALPRLMLIKCDHESPKEKKMEKCQCTGIFFPHLALSNAAYFFSLPHYPPCASLSFCALSPISYQVSLSLPLSLTHTLKQSKAVVHVLMVFWQSYSSGNCRVVSRRSTQSGWKCTRGWNQALSTKVHHRHYFDENHNIMTDKLPTTETFQDFISWDW